MEASNEMNESEEKKLSERKKNPSNYMFKQKEGFK